MTTPKAIKDALRAKVIEEWALPAHEGREALRRVYIAGEMFDRVDNDVSLHHAKEGEGGRTRYEQMLIALADFRCLQRPGGADIKRLMPTKKGVWSLHARGLRIFGWITEASAFVAVTYEHTEACHGRGSLVEARLADVLAFAEKYKLASTIQYGDLLALVPKNT